MEDAAMFGVLAFTSIASSVIFFFSVDLVNG